MTDIYKMRDGKNYFDYDKWIDYRNGHPFSYLFAKGKFFIDLEITHPKSRINMLDVGLLQRPRNIPHSEYGHNDLSTDCYYACDEWLVYEEYSAHWIDGTRCHRLLVQNEGESCERIILFSSSSNIWNEPWGRKIPNVFCFYKNKFWNVSHLEFLNREWMFNCNYPLVNRFRRMDVPTKFDPLRGSYYPEDFGEPSFYYEDDDPEIYFILQDLLDDVDDVDDEIYLALANAFLKKGDEFYKYILESRDINQLRYSPFISEIYQRPKNFRTAKFLFTCLTNAAVKVESIFELTQRYPEIYGPETHVPHIKSTF